MASSGIEAQARTRWTEPILSRPMTQPKTDAAPVIDWLVGDECRRMSLVDMFEAFSQRLLDAGYPVWRLRSTIIGMHPEVLGRAPRWTRGKGVEVELASVRVFASPMYRGSPIEALHKTGKRIRCALRLGDIPYTQLHELKNAGATDYVAYPIDFGRREASFLSIVTDSPEGFTDAQLADFERMIPPLALRLELESSRFSTETLLQLYLGANAAKRVLGGDFKRGSGQQISAAIWLCDLRGFTSLVDRLPLSTVVPVLDAYFETMAKPLNEEGGEILKFIGDSILAVFPIEGDTAKACRNAVKSAANAIREFEQSPTGQEHKLRVGVAVNVGEVMYGNIGAANRLDFTVIGAAVNEAARMESLCKALKTPLILSESVARHLAPEDLAPLGDHVLRGVSAERPLFTLAEFRP